ncbi:hypothetical protein DFQ30_000291 [Apophysomyces sp. BC1015]|nr:hypothetical protein DFQ30_000291 [Apophysomyces sp. BC1015]
MDGESTKDNDNDEDQNGHGSKKSKAVKRKVNEKKAVPNGRRKAKHVQEKEQPAVSVLRNKRRLRNSGDVADDKTSKESVRDTKKRRRSASANKEDENGYEGANSSPVPHNHEDESQASDDTATEKGKIKTFDVGMSKDIPGFKKMYQIRHKLQKLVYDKKPVSGETGPWAYDQGEIPTEDYSKIALIIQEIEKSTMTYNLLRETKIGKVVKAACSYAYEKDTEYNIKKRCQDLMKTWRAQFTNGQVSALESRAIITNVTSNSKTSKVDRETEPITTETVEERPPYGEQMAEPLLVGGMVAKDDTHTLSAVATHEKQTMLIDPPQDTMMQEA